MSRGIHTACWTDPAFQNLLEITRYIKADKPEAARRFARQIKEKVSRLNSFPHSGRIVPEFAVSGLREIIIGEYRIIYWIVSAKRRVEILTVHHGARQLGNQDMEHS